MLLQGRIVVLNDDSFKVSEPQPQKNSLIKLSLGIEEQTASPGFQGPAGNKGKVSTKQSTLNAHKKIELDHGFDGEPVKSNQTQSVAYVYMHSKSN